MWFLQFFFQNMLYLYNNKEEIELVSAVFHVKSYALSCLNKLAADILGVLSHRVSKKQNIFFPLCVCLCASVPFGKTVKELEKQTKLRKTNWTWE